MEEPGESTKSTNQLFNATGSGGQKHRQQTKKASSEQTKFKVTKQTGHTLEAISREQQRQSGKCMEQGQGLNTQVKQGTGDTIWAITEAGKHGKQNQQTTGLNTGSVLFKNKTGNTIKYRS